MYFTYRFYLSEKKIELYKFESNENVEKLIQSTCFLINNNFFDQYSSKIDKIFISKYNIDEKPLKNKKEFYIDINDIKKAQKYLIN
jgi:hypothetical protein